MHDTPYTIYTASLRVDMTYIRQHLPLVLLHRQLEHTNNDKDTSETSKSIFIGINVTIVVVLLICILGYCYFFRNRFDAIIRHQLELNEQAMAQNIRDRQFEQDRAHAAAARQRNRDRANHQDNDMNETNNDAAGNEDDLSPENRRSLLEASFLRNKVTMVSHLKCSMSCQAERYETTRVVA